jgi:uracil-DNA glycosylase family 4
VWHGSVTEGITLDARMLHAARSRRAFRRGQAAASSASGRRPSIRINTTIGLLRLLLRIQVYHTPKISSGMLAIVTLDGTPVCYHGATSSARRCPQQCWPYAKEADMEKQAALDALAKEVENCEECKKDKIGVAVFGEGNPDAAVAFIGEAPGKQEAKAGRPFIGPSGKLLRKTIREVLGLDDLKDVYITSPVKYLPERGTPSKRDIDHARTHFDKQLAIVDPKIVVLMGAVAAQAVLNEKVAVTSQHGTVLERDGRKYFITVHPAAGLRYPPMQETFQEDFRKLREVLATI